MVGVVLLLLMYVGVPVGVFLLVRRWADPPAGGPSATRRIVTGVLMFGLLLAAVHLGGPGDPDPIRRDIRAHLRPGVGVDRLAALAGKYGRDVYRNEAAGITGLELDNRGWFGFHTRWRIAVTTDGHTITGVDVQERVISW